MIFNIGDIVKLKDDGETEYVVLHTKESGGDKSLTKTAFDYTVKRQGDKKEGKYLRQVFKENLYKI